MLGVTGYVVKNVIIGLLALVEFMTLAVFFWDERGPW
jgi:hypothetical protein